MSLPAIMTVFQEVLPRLENAKIPYMVVGSLSSIVYGEPRMTKDMDIVIDIKKLDYFREGGSEKHLLDIRGILANTDIDQKYLESGRRYLVDRGKGETI